MTPQSKVYYVLGEVNAPGSFPLIGRETVLDAIVAAGGLTNRADHCDIILSRPSCPDDCRIVLPICYDQIVQLGDTSTNYQIMPGDRIFVATRSCWEGLCPGKKKQGCLECECGQYPCNAACPTSPGVVYMLPIPSEPAPPPAVPAPSPELLPLHQ